MLKAHVMEPYLMLRAHVMEPYLMLKAHVITLPHAKGSISCRNWQASIKYYSSIMCLDWEALKWQNPKRHSWQIEILEGIVRRQIRLSV